jgi:TetR/AcrR family transcriptional regulator, transcriptional repressor of bet genes
VENSDRSELKMKLDKINKRRTPKRKDIAGIREQQIIEAAIVVIGRKGLSGTTLGLVAEQAGIGYGNLTFRFKSKDALLIRALRAVADEYNGVRDSAACVTGRSPAERLNLMLAACFHRKVTSQKKVALWWAFLSECHINLKYSRVIAQLRASEYRQMKQICDEIIANGAYRELDSRLLAISINALIEGLWSAMRAGPQAIDRAEALAAARQYLSTLFPNEFKHCAAQSEQAENLANIDSSGK